MAVEKPADVRMESHFTIFVYPFYHRFQNLTECEELTALYDMWQPWICGFDDQTSLHRAFDDSFFFLPFARRLLYPEFMQYTNTDDGCQKLFAKSQSMKNASPKDCVENAASFLRESRCLHLSLRREHRETFSRITLISSNGDALRKLDATIDWAELYLFGQDIGLLSMKVRLAGDQPSSTDLMEFNRQFRIVHPPSISLSTAPLEISEHRDINTTRELVEYLLDKAAEGGGKEFLLSDAGQVYGERFQSIFFGCLSQSPEDGNTGSFASSLDRILYEFAASQDWGSSIDQGGIWEPSPEAITSIFSENVISVWNIWKGLALKDSVVFLGKSPNSFVTYVLAHNIEFDYYHLYIYAAYQKMRLYGFSDELVGKTKSLKRSLQRTRHLLDKFMEFRNHFWFLEVTKKAQGDYIYRKYRTGLGTDKLFERIDNEISDLNSYYESRLSRRTAAMLNFLTFIATPGFLVTGFLGLSVYNTIGLKYLLSWNILILSVLGMYGLSLLVFIVWRWFMNR